MKKTIAFIGSAGVPNIYGGFEMFLESCTPGILKSFAKVFVTCDRSKYADRSRNWRGVTRVFVPVGANGASSVVHDLLAFFAVLWRADAIVVLGVSGGIFFPLFRLICSLMGKKLIVNVDGIEWRRAKFSGAKRTFLYISDRLAQLFAHEVIVDNEALRPFLVRSVQKSATLIAYPGDHVTRVPKREAAPGSISCLTICRIEPENNCHVLIEAFAKAGRGTYTFVGNWEASSYGRALRERFRGVEGLSMLDPIYDPEKLADMRENCTAYLHGHSVGGTNPSLVEMLFYDCEILAFDCAFNRATAGESIQYFADADELAAEISSGKKTVPRNRLAVREIYTEAKICDAYVRLINSTAQVEGLPAEENDGQVLQEEVNVPR